MPLWVLTGGGDQVSSSDVAEAADPDTLSGGDMGATTRKKCYSLIHHSVTIVRLQDFLTSLSLI